ncbi:MAG: 50S ribosomal protein L30 [Spirochaetaceae bacterium]|nr:MAG: 50S ribosomal protein L30 [Spirochaetaceae bacterium]
MMQKIRIRLIRSPIGQKPQTRKTVRALGLKRLSSSVVHEATAPVLGMVRAVSHLVEVEELSTSRSSE